MWAAPERGAVAWVSLDGYDNQPTVFRSHLLMALRRSGVAVPEALPAVGQGRAADHVFFLRLAAVLAARNPPVTLVLDDLDLLVNAKVLDGLDYMLRYAGSGLRLVVASRADPLLPLHRYRLAGELTEIRASDLAFSIAEAGLLVAQHGHTLSADSLECLIRRTEGWVAGIRLAAISMDTRPDPDQAVKELTAENSALTGYLVEEVLNAQPPEARKVLLSTSILEQVSAEAASELAGNERAAGILSALARANVFVQPVGSGWYRYHTLFAEVLRLKLAHEHSDRIANLHRRAARWYERNGQLTDAVRHAARAGDWQHAARMVIDGLAISEIVEPQDGPSLADEFRKMPLDRTWIEPQPYLVSAAIAWAAGRHESCTAALEAAEGILGHHPADQQAAARLAAAMLRLPAAFGIGDLIAAASAADRAEVMADRIPGDKLVPHPEIAARVLTGRGAVELCLGHFDEAARLLDSEAAAATASGGEAERADRLGRLALVEALRGRLGRAAKLATRVTADLTTDGQRTLAQHPGSAALVALAWVHLERNELREARSRVKQADAALGVTPDKLIGTVARLVAARGSLAEGRARMATQLIAVARSGWRVPVWLEQRLSSTESRAHAAAGDIEAALAAAKRAGDDDSPEAAVALAHALAAAGDDVKARRALMPALSTRSGELERVRLQALLVDARLSYNSGDQPRGRRSLASALQLAEPEQFRLPFVLERAWILLVLRHDSELAGAYRRLFAPSQSHRQFPAPRDGPKQTTMQVVEPLSEREREVLRHVSGMLSSAEIATEMYISINTVKSHLKSINRKLAAASSRQAVRRARQLQLI
jgi:LuxR family maltose regulon positive regulatory protein